MCFSGHVGSCLGQQGQQVEPSTCFSHARLWSLWLPSEVSLCAWCIIFCWGYQGCLAAFASTMPDLAVPPALPPVLCLSITSLLLSHLALARLLGAGLLPPSRGRWLRLPSTKGGSTCPPSSCHSPTPRCTLPQSCCSLEPSTSPCSSQTLQKPAWQSKVIIFLPYSFTEGVGQCGSGEGGIMAVSWLRLLWYCKTSAALALQGVFNCDILLVLYAESCRRSMPTCNVV